jgi:NhaA family Na+:H+ antiporter
MPHSQSSRPSAGSLKPDPPEASEQTRRIAKKVLAPIERFLAIEASSGIVLLIAAVVALIWANSPLHETYEHLWHTPIGVRFGGFSFERDLHFVINDGLMTVFFFVVGLEIRREMHGGELSELRRAALPLAAALGGMVVPASLYAAFNHDLSSASGWGVPTATDIAFALGALALLGKRVAPALRVLLLALAVVDDIGAIIVIAVFYSSGISIAGVLLALAGMIAIAAMKKLGIRSPLAYVAPALVVWSGVYVAGAHPTLAGVIVGLMTPVRAWFGPEGLLDHAAAIGGLRGQGAAAPTEREILPHLDTLRTAEREAVSPVERLQHALHGWVAFGIMPLFALANAGVALGGASLEGEGMWVFSGVMLGLIAGKPLGIVAVSWLAVRSGIATLPRGLRFLHVAVVGVVAGIGFTMSIFIAQLAFTDPELLATAKLAVLCASGVAALVGLVVGYLVLSPDQQPVGALTELEAECSTDA